MFIFGGIAVEGYLTFSRERDEGQLKVIRISWMGKLPFVASKAERQESDRLLPDSAH